MEVVSSKLCLVEGGQQSKQVKVLNPPIPKWLMRVSNLAVSLQLIPEPFKVRVSSPHTGFLHAENWKIGLKPALIVSVPLGSHPVGDGVDHVNLQKICRGRVGIVKSLLFAGKLRFVQITLYLKIFTCSVSLWHHHLP